MSNICPRCGMPYNGDYCRVCHIKEHAASYKGGSAGPAHPHKPSMSADSPIFCTISILDNAEMQGSGKFKVGTLEVKNESGTDCNLGFTVSLDGTEIAAERFVSKRSEAFKTSIVLDTTLLESEVDLKKTVSVAVIHSGETIGMKSKSVIFRPYFDMNLENLCDLAARWTTPGAKAIKDLLLPDGPIAEAMRAKYGAFQISGYQGATAKEVIDNVLMQMKSTYIALQNMGFDYVSDTFTNPAGAGSCQRVKTPRKVLEDKSGNCIELSCLFASIFEAMGLCPVILFPPGHAMCGVQLTSLVVPPVNAMSIKEDVPLPRFTFTDAGTRESTVVLCFETTAITNPDASFDAAARIGSKTVAESKGYLDRNRVCVIGLKRKLGIEPMVESIGI